MSTVNGEVTYFSHPIRHDFSSLKIINHQSELAFSSPQLSSPEDEFTYFNSKQEVVKQEVFKSGDRRQEAGGNNEDCRARHKVARLAMTEKGTAGTAK